MISGLTLSQPNPSSKSVIHEFREEYSSEFCEKVQNSHLTIQVGIRLKNNFLVLRLRFKPSTLGAPVKLR